MSSGPSVSVVTPFYNTAPYIAECIESVLAQTYRDFEYVLVNNRSTDGSREIAARYAARDERIRLFDTDRFLGQVENFNGALARISPASRFVKMVLADDAIFPECLRRMVDVAEREPGVGIVSSYRMWGDHPDRGGVPLGTSRVPGREACRQIVVEKLPLTGSQSTVLYRADLVRARPTFFTPGRHFTDTETAIEILLEHDLGFVHQILSFTRTENESVWTRTRVYDPLPLHFLTALETYGARFLPPDELRRARKKARRDYFQSVGYRALRLPRREFWEFHRKGLEAIGWKLRWRDVLFWTGIEALRLLLNPESTVERAIRSRRRRPDQAAPGSPA